MSLPEPIRSGLPAIHDRGDLGEPAPHLPVPYLERHMPRDWRRGILAFVLGAALIVVPSSLPNIWGWFR